jgi:hypothetical protein
LRTTSSNFTANGSLLELIADRPTLSFAGQMVSIGLSCFHVLPSAEMAPEMHGPGRRRPV